MEFLCIFCFYVHFIVPIHAHYQSIGATCSIRFRQLTVGISALAAMRITSTIVVAYLISIQASVCISFVALYSMYSMLRGHAQCVQLLISLWMTGSQLQRDIVESTAKPTGEAFLETLQMAGGGASRADVLELCAAVLNVKSGCETREFPSSKGMGLASISNRISEPSHASRLMGNLSGHEVPKFLHQPVVSASPLPPPRATRMCSLGLCQ